MHPILVRKSRLVLYLLLWLPIGSSLASLLLQTTELGWRAASALAMPLAIVYAFACLGTFYVCRAYPLRGGGLGGLFVTHMTTAVVSSGVWVGLAVGWGRVLDRVVGNVSGRLGSGGGLVLFAVGILLMMLASATHYLYLAMEKSRDEERRGLRLQVLAREAELKALRAQIDPHFLFNSLNSISALTTVDPAGARRMCVLLGDFLRGGLKLGAQDRIPLADEVALVRQFLEIERVRFGERLASSFEIDPGAGACLVPPLVLQPLVENAVRHGIAGLVGGGTIHVAAGCRDGRLRLVVENPYDAERAAPGGAGLGLANVKSRLITEFGHDARVDAVARGGVYRVELSLPASAPVMEVSRS
jgi:LytS/YehU family sensor histidine kinase